ncbi:MAG: tetratricopeptide repeat protein [Candidatus Omnitrophica bacterium]|nr:tetratricopeptide repeat protein [Candidatus Omnitrophota bacterium]
MKIKFFVFILIATVCFLAYFTSLGNPFIWDDEALVVQNTLIRSVQNLPLSFTNDLYFGVNSGSNFYRPLQTISYIFDYHFWQLEPSGFHLTNIILQIGVSFLVFLLIFNLIENLPVAIASAVFFAASPIHTEAVTYISGRAEMLMGLFVILSLLFFIRSQNNIKRPLFLYILSIFSFVLAILSKEVAIVFPFIICGYIFFFLKEKLKKKHYFVKTIFPYFVISIIYLLLRLTLFNFLTLRPPALANVSWFIRLSVFPKVILTYFKLLFFPVGLHMNRELLRPTSPVGILVAVFFIGLIIFTCWRYLIYREKNKVVSFMLLWSLVFFIPQSGIFPINAFVAEHFIYLPSISFFMLVAYIFHRALRKGLFILVVGLFTVFYIILSAGRNFEWRNPLVFYKNIIKYSPNSFQAHNNLGLQYEYLGRLKEAENEYKRAIEIKSDLIEAHSNLANLYFKLKLYNQAKAEYILLEKSQLGAKAAEVYNNLGNIYEVTRFLDDAIVKYNQALKLDPSLKFTHFNLARIYLVRGNFDLAVSHILGSLGESGLGTDTLKRKIIADFLKNTTFINNAAMFYNNLGINFAQNNLWNQAVSAFICALDLDPKSCDYYYNLGLAYLNKGEDAKAKFALNKALKINPNHIRAKRLIADKK